MLVVGGVGGGKTTHPATHSPANQHPLTCTHPPTMQDLFADAHRLAVIAILRTLVKRRTVAKKRYQAVGFPCNRMLKLSSRGIRIDVPVLSVSWSFEDHSVNIKALRKGLIEHEASDTGGVPRWQSSCPDRLAEATISRYFSELCWRSLTEELGRCCSLQ